MIILLPSDAAVEILLGVLAVLAGDEFKFRTPPRGNAKFHDGSAGLKSKEAGVLDRLRSSP